MKAEPNGPRDEETRQAFAAAVAEIAVSAGPPSPAMRATFAEVVRMLGLSATECDQLLASAEAAWDEPEGVLPASLCPPSRPPTRESLDEAYIRQVVRYDPVAMAQLGAEIAALAVHRLADLTLIYESDVARLNLVEAGEEAVG